MNDVGAAPVAETGPAFLLPGTEGERPFDAAGLEDEFRTMWKSAAPSRGALYRAALANVIVPLHPERHAPLDPVLIELTRRHPSRLFRIQAAPRRADGATGLTARASAYCHRRPGNGGIVCSEQVVLSAPPGAESLVPSAVASMLIGDIPVILLHIAGDDTRTPWVELEAMADTILEDSATRDDVAAMGAVWERIAAAGSARARDIAWSRLTPWRELLAEVFDQPLSSASITSLRDVTIHYGGAVPPAGAWLLAGWFASRLSWSLRSRQGASYGFATPGKDAAIAFKRNPDVSDNVITSVRLRCGKPHALDVVVSHRGRAAVATVEFVAPTATTFERTFGYREFAPCLIGELNRHAANAAHDAAARVAVAMAQMKSAA